MHHHNSAVTYSSDVVRAPQDLFSKTANKLTISLIYIYNPKIFFTVTLQYQHFTTITDWQFT